MATITIANMPEDLHQRLNNAAEKDGRSIDQEALALLDRALRRVEPIKLPTPIIPLRPFSAEEIAAGIREGRE